MAIDADCIDTCLLKGRWYFEFAERSLPVFMEPKVIVVLVASLRHDGQNRSVATAQWLYLKHPFERMSFDFQTDRNVRQDGVCFLGAL